MRRPPIEIEFMLACYVSPKPAGVLWPGGWDSPAGKATRRWLISEGLVTAEYEVTDRGSLWVEAILSTPLPEGAPA